MYSCIRQGVATQTNKQLNREKDNMASVIIDMIYKLVSRPAAIIHGGEIYFTDLPEGTTEILAFLRGYTGGGHVDLIRTKAEIDMWVNDEFLTTYASQPNSVARTFSLALGGRTTEIYGPVILAGNTTDGDTVPLTDNQLGHVVRLSTMIHIPISTMRTQ